MVLSTFVLSLVQCNYLLYHFLSPSINTPLKSQHQRKKKRKIFSKKLHWYRENGFLIYNQWADKKKNIYKQWCSSRDDFGDTKCKLPCVGSILNGHYYQHGAHIIFVSKFVSPILLVKLQASVFEGKRKEPQKVKQIIMN